MRPQDGASFTTWDGISFTLLHGIKGSGVQVSLAPLEYHQVDHSRWTNCVRARSGEIRFVFTHSSTASTPSWFSCSPRCRLTCLVRQRGVIPDKVRRLLDRYALKSGVVCSVTHQRNGAVEVIDRMSCCREFCDD